MFLVSLCNNYENVLQSTVGSSVSHLGELSKGMRGYHDVASCV